MQRFQVPPHFFVVIIFCCAGAFFEISFVNVAVQLASNDSTSNIPLREYIFAMLAPVTYIVFYSFFYFTSVIFARSKLNDLLSLSLESEAEDISKGHLYKTISDDYIVLVESVLFPSYLFIYRIAIVITLTSNILWILLVDQPFLLVAVLIIITIIGIIFHKLMRLLAKRFSKIQNIRHNSMNLFVDLSSYREHNNKDLIASISRIFPYKFIQNSMGGLVKPLIDLLMIAVIVYLIIGEPTNYVSAAVITGIGATGWRMIGPTINLFVAWVKSDMGMIN